MMVPTHLRLKKSCLNFCMHELQNPILKNFDLDHKRLQTRPEQRVFRFSIHNSALFRQRSHTDVVGPAGLLYILLPWPDTSVPVGFKRLFINEGHETYLLNSIIMNDLTAQAELSNHSSISD